MRKYKPAPSQYSPGFLAVATVRAVRRLMCRAMSAAALDLCPNFCPNNERELERSLANDCGTRMTENWLFLGVLRRVAGFGGQECGGERGIRTLETVPRLHAFQACAFNHSATSPFFEYTGNKSNNKNNFMQVLLSNLPKRHFVSPFHRESGVEAGP